MPYKSSSFRIAPLSHKNRDPNTFAQNRGPYLLQFFKWLFLNQCLQYRQFFLLALALLNQIFAIVGFPRLDIEEDTIYQTVTLIFTIGLAAWAWWKNNSFTKEAQYYDDVLKSMKEKN